MKTAVWLREMQISDNGHVPSSNTERPARINIGTMSLGDVEDSLRNLKAAGQMMLFHLDIGYCDDVPF